ncbi:TPA: HK97 gp10 family phage protein [Streptococcus suis]|nr:HK97 gp10 family phage protein [Streptococcus suis]
MSQLVGADKLIAKLKRLSSQRQTEIVARAVHNAAKNVVQADAKLRAPVNDEDLRTGIKVRMSKSGNPRAEVVSTSDHGAYVELGTGPKGAANHAGVSPEVSVSYRSTPWLIPTTAISYKNAIRYKFPLVLTSMGAYYRTYGQAAQPYLYPALKDNTERVTNNISKYVKRKLVEEVTK